MATRTLPGRLATVDEVRATIEWLDTIGIVWPSRHMRRYVGRCIGPRKVGGQYWCAYWRETYTVTDLHIDRRGGWSISVRWHGDGQYANPRPAREGIAHMTPWEMQRDRVVSQVEGNPLP